MAEIVGGIAPTIKLVHNTQLVTKIVCKPDFSKIPGILCTFYFFLSLNNFDAGSNK